uniref:Uncharacterized protein n=1 Tax=Rhizophora mucronata TaxID=61149 RepID=A0A2P2K7R6_RHIMU
MVLQVSRLYLPSVWFLLLESSTLVDGQFGRSLSLPFWLDSNVNIPNFLT